MLTPPTTPTHDLNKPAASRSREWSLILMAMALLLGLASHGLEIFWQRDALLGMRQAQEPQIQAAAKVRAQLDSIARETAMLASKGNSNARIVVEALKQRGVSIDPNAAPVQQPTL